MTKKKASTKKINKGKNNKYEKNIISDLGRIIVVIVIAFVIFCILTSFITKYNKTYSWENKNETSVLQYDKIMFGTLLKQKEKEYYVLAINYSDENKDIYDTYIGMCEDIKIYKVNLDEDFNKKYFGENSILNVDDVNDLKVKGITLFEIKNNKIEKTYEGNEQVSKKLKELIK